MTPRSPLFRLLLRLYPRAYRERYGAEMEAFHTEERAAGEGRGLHLVVDHVRAAAGVRRQEGRGTMRKVIEDLASGWRALRRAPSFTLFAVLTLALGVGATTAVFSVLDRVVLRPLPYPGAERLVRIGIEPRHDPGSLGPLSGALMLGLQEDTGPAEAVVGASETGVILDDGGEPRRTQLTRVTRGFFEFLGARPAQGRLAVDQDYDPGAERVVVLGHGFWRDRYGADPAVVGRTLRLSDETYTVVGVLAPDFVPPPEIVEARDLWTPLPLTGEHASTGRFFLGGLARLRPGATLADLDAHADRVVEALYAGDGPGFLAGGSVSDYRTDVLGSIGSTLTRVLGAVVILLLIACVNVASLLLTRGAQRARELAVRVALGAGRSRLVRQLLSESALIALAGGALGSALAWGSVELFRLTAPAGLPRLDEVAVDGRGLAFCLALAAGTVVLFGLLPALRSTARAAPGDALGRRVTGGRAEGRQRAGLVVLETALAVVLAVSSALLAHDLMRIAREDPGMQPEGLLAARVDLAPRFEQAEWADVWQRMLDGARALPGVTSASVATQAPYAGTRMATMVRPEGHDESEGEFVVQTAVAGDYASTLGARVLEGRGLTARDDGAEPVVVVNGAFVRRYWPDHSPAAAGGPSAVGKLIRSGGEGAEDEPTWTVVGVLDDIRTGAGQDPWPQVYLPLQAAPWRDMELMLRTDGDPALLADGVRALVRRVDATLPVTRIATVESLAAEGRARPRFYTGLFGGFALVALLLAVVGVYGTTAYATRARTREIGIRLALGALRRRLVAGVVLRTAAIVALGIGLGLAGAALATRAMTDVLTYVTPDDTLAYLAVAAVVLTAGVVAAWIPAERAGRVDPVDALREEG
jgi:putative ABC transport system permease protein